jgi:hypothetical protein
MRKLCLTLVAATAVLSTGALTSRSEATTLGAVGGLRGAIEDSNAVEQVRLVCTHFYNGRWHPREMCVWVGGHRGGHGHGGWGHGGNHGGGQGWGHGGRRF